MGVTANHAIGRRLKFFCAYEPTAGTYVKPIGADAAKVLTTTFDHQREQEVRADSRQTRSALERILGKSVASWSLEGYALPGSPPDLHQLFFASLGAYSDPTYSLASTQQIRTLSLTRAYDGVWAEAMWGCWVDELKFSWSGGDNPKVSASGGAMGYALSGQSSLDGAVAGSPNLTVDAVEQENLQVNSMIQVGSDDNSGAGFLVSSRTGTAVVVDANVTANDNDLIVPFCPTETVAGAPINRVTGSLTWSGITLPLISGELTVTNNNKPFDDEAFKEFPDDVIPGYRNVTGQVQARLRRDVAIHLANRYAYSQRAIVVTLGSGSGTSLTINVPTAELDFAAVNIPEAEEAIMTLPFVGIATSAGDDEMTLAH